MQVCLFIIARLRATLVFGNESQFFKRLDWLFEIVQKTIVSDSLRRLAPCDVLFFCHDVDRGLNLQGKAYSPLIDSIRDEFEREGICCQAVAHPWSRLTGPRAWGSPISMNRSFFIALARSKVGSARWKPKRNLLPVRTHVIRLYEAIMRRSTPVSIITIGSPPELCMAARRLGIKQIELLHGIGYTRIRWGWDERTRESLPSGIFALDGVSANTFSKLDMKDVKVFQIAHPFLKRFFNDHATHTLPLEWQPESMERLTELKKEVLVTLVWGYAGDHGSDDEFKGVLANGLYPEALEAVMAKTEKEILWRFRLHPVHLRDPKYKYLTNAMDDLCRTHKNAEWRSSSSLPLPTVLKSCSGNMTMESMSAYDAAFMGVPSLILCPTVQPGGIREQRFADLEISGYVTKSDMTSEAIYTWSSSVKKLPPYSSDLDNDGSWRKAKAWMLDSLKK